MHQWLTPRPISPGPLPRLIQLGLIPFPPWTHSNNPRSILESLFWPIYLFPLSEQHFRDPGHDERPRPQRTENMSSRLTLDLCILHVSSWIWVRDSGIHCSNGNEPGTRLRQDPDAQRGALLAAANERQIYASNIGEDIDLFSWTTADYCRVTTQP